MRSRYVAALLVIAALCAWSTVFAAADGSRLTLPPGTAVAIVVFEDLQCPDCARIHPVLIEAAAANSVPLVIHDFPITRHQWAFPAAVLARYFTAQSPALGIEFRSFIFENQKDINAGNLREFGERFAADHNLALPADVDPDGRFQAQVQADFDLGREIQLEYVPLVFVVGPGDGPTRAVEVTDPTQLDEVITRARVGSAH
jgi:protein-disulfide isomerase